MKRHRAMKSWSEVKREEEGEIYRDKKIQTNRKTEIEREREREKRLSFTRLSLRAKKSPREPYIIAGFLLTP